MLKNLLFFKTGTVLGYSTSKPKTLYKMEPLTIQLNPVIVMAGILMFLVILLIGFGSIENYNFLLSGV